MTPIPTFEEVQAKARDHQELREMIWQLLAPGHAYMAWRVRTWMRWIAAFMPGIDRKDWDRRVLEEGTQRALIHVLHTPAGDEACLRWALETARAAQRVGCCDSCAQHREGACTKELDRVLDAEAPLLAPMKIEPRTDCTAWEPRP